ncbi:E3 ubiquitin-protein ligase synoviolin [Dermatophagoides pteronyssinus]|uniref:RING-type E3 ubiquitin transferase n=1 Tax=Dermatophagoides pteronyssinus TaxID=6956 RepID=A0ABQ8JIT8_DERPT|nr:E3 ubiquitin-protein ligase synoviolin [Dermatophagoides pteronyssinus]
MPMSFMESTFLFVISGVLSSLVITNAYYQKQQFYPSVVYITKSNASMGIIYLQGLILVILIGKLIGKIFFGQLRTAEIEHLIERSWYAVTETCLAFTVFRDDLSPKFVALFTLLLFLKCFHWLAEDRVDYMERSPNISVFFHIRVVSLLSILGVLDAIFVYMAYHSTLSKGASVQLVFGFEYAILFAIILNIAMKYILHFFDLYNENPWEDKAIYLLYTELIMGFLKITLYLIFIFIMMKIHTFPLFSIRPMYLAIRNFKKAFNDVIMSRRAIRNMNAYYPNATAQDIENSDNVCIICRENMLGNGSCKKLPCNHIFHISCLRSWFQRQQTCPTCRMDILRVNQEQQQQQAGNGQAAAAAANNNNNQQPPGNNNNLPQTPLTNNQQQQQQRQQQQQINGQIPFPPFTHPLFFQQFHQFFGQQQQRREQQQSNTNNQQQQQTTGENSNPGTTTTQQSSSSSTTTTNDGTNNNAGTSSSSSTSTTTTLPSITSIPATVFPFLQSPPFPMPSIPSIDTLLQGFSDDELRYLEGQTRQQLEQRIKCLMDVKTLITAAMIRLQQYNCVILNCPIQNSIGTQTTFESNVVDQQQESNSVSTANTLNETKSSNVVNNLSSPSAQSTSTSSSSSTLRSTIFKNSHHIGGDNPDNNDNDQDELIRQRRLQRFTKNSNPQDDDNNGE